MRVLCDANELPHQTTLECDICIVGAGVAGLTLAREFEGTPLSVIVLEAGGERYDAHRQDDYRGEVAPNSRHPPPHLYRHSRLGGTSAIWGGRCVPLDEIDFEKRSHVPLSGWPFTRAALDPYYGRAQRILDAGVFDYAVSGPLKPLIEGFADEAVQETLERYSPPVDFWRRYRRELRESANVRVVSGAQCQKIETDEGGCTVVSVECRSARGGALTVRAKKFIACVGGLEIVRLLTNEGGRPLGDHSSMLGRTYMCHIESGAAHIQLWPRSRAARVEFQRAADGAYCNSRFGLAPRLQEDEGLLNAIVRLHHANILDPAHHSGILSAMYLTKRFLLPEYRRKFTASEYSEMAGLHANWRFWARHALNVGMDAPALARFGVSWIRNRYMRARRIPYVNVSNRSGAYTLDFNGEQAPNPQSRVLLSPERGADGRRSLLVDWRCNALDLHSLETTLSILRERLARSGCAEISFDREALAAAVGPIGGHHLGTTRMSDNPRNGVVDATCRVHHTANLYVAGGSVFPTSGHANPTLTIVALACRLADHLKSGAPSLVQASSCVESEHR